MNRDGGFCAALLRFDDETSTRLVQIVGELAAQQDRTLRADAYPHVTLLPTDGSNDVERVEAITGLCRTARRVPLRLSNIGTFPDSGVVYLGVTVTRPLLDLHREVSKVLSPAVDTPFLDLYDDGAWIPHCTVGSGLSPWMLGEAVEWLSERVSLPIDAFAVAIDFVRVLSDGLRVVGSMPLCV